MITLSLLRHAKSSWNEGGLEDFERPLAPRGLKAAPAMGRYMRVAGVAPDLVMCSPARRTRQTLELVLPFLSPQPNVMIEDELYPSAPDDILTRLREAAEPHGHVMVIAHNPGLQTVARRLAGSGEPALVEELGVKFPTCALAVLAFPDGWEAVGPGRGELRLFMAPRRLPREG